MILLTIKKELRKFKQTNDKGMMALLNKLGNAQAQSLFDRVKTQRVHQGAAHEIGSEGYYKNTDNWPSARKWEDYRVTIDREGLPTGVEIIER